MIYYAYFHSGVTHGLLFWGNSSHSMTVFRLQMKTIRIMIGARSKDSCIKFFKILGILLLMAQYIYYNYNYNCVHCQEQKVLYSKF